MACRVYSGRPPPGTLLPEARVSGLLPLSRPCRHPPEDGATLSSAQKRPGWLGTGRLLACVSEAREAQALNLQIR